MFGVWRPTPLRTSRVPPEKRFGRWREERFWRDVFGLFDLAVYSLPLSVWVDPACRCSVAYKSRALGVLYAI